MGNYLLISDAAKEVEVETHVLRYWEEELRLPIKRNELGHRYYTKEDVERFKQIKSMKERGLQLKAIKMILKNGKLDVLETEQAPIAIDIIGSRDMVAEEAIPENIAETVPETTPETVPETVMEAREEKARRLQWLLQQLIRETLQENNKELCRDIKESVVKELDYQFRMQEEREEERDKLQMKRSEEYYKRMDEILRKKSRVKKERNENPGKNEKRKRHSIF